MFINDLGSKELSDYVYNNILATEKDLVKVIYEDDKFEYLRNLKFIELYFNSGTKMLVDQGNPTLSDSTGYDLLIDFIPELSKETLDNIKKNYKNYNSVSAKEMEKLFRLVLAEAYNNNQECKDIYRRHLLTLGTIKKYTEPAIKISTDVVWSKVQYSNQNLVSSFQKTSLFGGQPRRKFNNKDNLYMIIDPRAVLAGRNKIGHKTIQENIQHSAKKAAELISDNALLKIARRVGQ